MKKIIFVLLLAVLMLFVSCGKSESKTGSTSGTVTETSTKTAEKKKIEINVGINTGWDTLSPFRSNIGNNLPVISTITYESLGYLDGSNTLVPWIAKEWKTEDNGVTYDIIIWDYITDSEGNKITSEDIVWAVETSKEKALKPNYKYVESIEATGDYSVRVKFNNTLVGVFETFMTDTLVCSKAEYEKAGDDYVNSCVTTSVYKVTGFVSGSSMEYTKRDDYWQDYNLLPEQLRATVDKVKVHVIPEAAQLGIALETGVVDFVLNFPASTAVQFDGDSDYTLQRADARNGMQIFFSGAEGKPVAEDKYLRQAICYAINNQLMIDAALEGYGTEMHDSAATYAMGYQKEWLDEEYYPYNVEKAKECLAKSNYKGEELVLLGSSTTKTVAEIIQNCCAAVGINIKLDLRQVALVTAIRLDGTQYDMFINQVGGITLANHWNTRYDCRSYKTGDATSRHDYVLADMIAEASTVKGFTPENINKVHNYIKEEAYGYGMYQLNNLAVWNNKVGIKEVVNDNINMVVPTACIYN